MIRIENSECTEEWVRVKLATGCKGSDRKSVCCVFRGFGVRCCVSRFGLCCLFCAGAGRGGTGPVCEAYVRPLRGGVGGVKTRGTGRTGRACIPKKTLRKQRFRAQRSDRYEMFS